MRLKSEKHAPVRVVFHLLFHEGIFGETKGELLIEAEKSQAALQSLILSVVTAGRDGLMYLSLQRL